MDDITYIYTQEMKDKKKLANASRHNSGVRGKRRVSKVVFASENMSGKSKREYEKSGEVKTYNMYDTILSREEFEAQPIDTQRAMMMHWRKKYTNLEIMQGLGIRGSGTFYKILNDLDISQRKIRQSKRVTKQRVADRNVNIVREKHDKKVNTMKVNGLHLEFNGEYNADELTKILTKLQLIIEGEHSKYNVSIDFYETGKDESLDDNDDSQDVIESDESEENEDVTEE